MKNLLILGCGWLGYDLAVHFKNKGYSVWGTTTNDEKYHLLNSDGIFAYIHDFDTDNNIDLPVEVNFDVVITSVPASNKNAIEEIEFRFSQIFRTLSGLAYKQHVFFSSVGIYPDIDRIFDEDYTLEEKMTPKLLLAEKVMKKLPNTTIFRLGGLFGKKRIFAKYFQNKLVTTGNQPANFIHLEDVIGMMEESIEKELPIGIYNLVCPDHPLKKDVILKSAEKYILERPAGFSPENSFKKVVIGDKLPKMLDYSFKYPSPLDF